MEGTSRVKTAVIIPARLGSRRFPRKVLARDTGKYLVEHVHERVVGCPGVSDVIIATDSAEVFDACRSFGARVVMTSSEHASGTDRVAEVARGLEHDVVINVQGDEPLIAHADIRTLLGLFEEEQAGFPLVMGTLVARRTDREGFEDPNIVKAVVDQNGWALYFSRAPVPHPPLRQAPQPADPGSPAGSRTTGSRTTGSRTTGSRTTGSRTTGSRTTGSRTTGSRTTGSRTTGSRPGAAGNPRLPSGEEGPEWYQHIGIYAYRRAFLLELSALPSTALEKRERLEQLRVLENGYRIRVGISTSRHLGIDTPEEYAAFVAEYRSGRLG
jgi:3-deoxy-D-manno-octulosonate cytidylyltransferase